MPDPINKIMAREKFPKIGIPAYQSRLVGKLQNKSEMIWIFPQMALITSKSACINLPPK
jgi:hypothetical protein